MNRRRFLSGAGAILVALVAGCASRIGGEESQPTEGLPIRLWLEEVSLPTAEEESITPIVFGNLSAGERDIVQIALASDEYTVEQGSESQSLESLRDRIEQQTGNGNTLAAYLRRDDTDYRVGFADGDHIIAHPGH